MSANVVMVPLDGSPAAEVALPWAVRLARGAGGPVRLVGVHAPPAVLLDGETLVGSVVPDEAIRSRETTYFADVQARLAGTGVPVAADLMDGGVIPSLAEYARTLRPAWVVMMSHARGPVARFFLGETAHEFVRESPCPVLLVHPTDKPVDVAAPPTVSRVLVGLDGSGLAAKILGPATDFAKAVGAEVTLFTVHGSGATVPAEPYLATQADRLRAAGIDATCRVAHAADAATALVTEADSQPGTVVALSTHGRGGLSQVLWGSVADTVVRRAHAPVLLFKPSEP